MMLPAPRAHGGRWVGHAAVAVLDGGMQQWPGPLQSGPTSARQSSSFTVAKSLTRTIEVEQLLDGTKRTLIDARAEARWAGREEPIDLVAGHIPGAICRPFPENIGPEGRFRTATELAKRFESEAAGDVVLLRFRGNRGSQHSGNARSRAT